MRIAAIQKTTLVDYPGKVATIIFTPSCNFRCPFCHNPETVLPDRIKETQHDFIPEEVFLNFLNKKKNVLDAVVICGGEPTLHSDLIDFTQKIKEIGLLVKLDTNGRDADTLRQLIDNKLVDYVAIDIKAPLSKYNELTGVPLTDVFVDNYKRCLSILKESDIDYEYRTTLIKGYHTQEDMHNMLKFLGNIKKYYIQNYRSEKTLDPNFDGQSFTDKELDEFLQIVKQYVSNCGIRD